MKKKAARALSSGAPPSHAVMRCIPGNLFLFRCRKGFGILSFDIISLFLNHGDRDEIDEINRGTEDQAKSE